MNDMPARAKKAAVALALLLAIAFILLGRDYTGRALEFDSALLKVMRQDGIDARQLRYEKQERYKSGRNLFLKVERHYEVGPEFDADNFIGGINKLCKKLKFSMVKSAVEKEGEKQNFLFFFAFKGRVLYELKFLKNKYDLPAQHYASRGGKIAIVLDDFGYNTNNLDGLFGISSRMTISVLPNLPYSGKISKEAAKRQLEVMLHLPLEPHGESKNLEKGTIMVDMRPDKVDELLSEAIKSVPGIKGVSNHMGSSATESRPLMRTLFMELRRRNLYFLDNLVTDKSVCGEIAKDVSLRTAARDVFLDNKSDEAYIEGQVLQAADLAARTGRAIAVGHDRPSTIKVLAKVIPRLERAGFEFVYVSEFVK